MIDRDRLEQIVRVIDRLPQRAAEEHADDLIETLRLNWGANFQFICGAHQLRVAGITATCSYSKVALLRNWQRHARRKLEGEVAE